MPRIMTKHGLRVIDAELEALRRIAHEIELRIAELMCDQDQYFQDARDARLDAMPDRTGDDDDTRGFDDTDDVEVTP